MGLIERDGEVKTQVIPNTRKHTLFPVIQEHVEPGATVSTDDMHTYTDLHSLGYDHSSVNHSEKQWRKGVHHTGIEGYWNILKNSIRSTHIHVSRKHIDKYLGEFEYRHNTRSNPSRMFPELISTYPERGDQ